MLNRLLDGLMDQGLLRKDERGGRSTSYSLVLEQAPIGARVNPRSPSRCAISETDYRLTNFQSADCIPSPEATIWPSAVQPV